MKLHVPTLILLVSASMLLSGCFEDGAVDEQREHPEMDRESKIPVNAVKVTPETDVHPPILHSDEYEDPVPMSDVINTAGGEDSPFILPDGNTFYFFFTPDVSVPPEKQLIDDVTGIYVSNKVGGAWSEPERVWLQDPGKLALDGAHTIDGNRMYFASAREGYTGLHIFTVEMIGGEWTNWEYSGNRLKELEVGELHVVGDDIYFHSGREGGKGAYDIWRTTWDRSDWTEPVNIEEVNSDQNDGWPYLTPEGNEIWFTRQYLGTPSIWRSEKINGTWQDSEMILSQFAGEPTLDAEGNIYFAHHYFKDDKMIEADFYICYRK
jgi:WD40 repeat protein